MCRGFEENDCTNISRHSVLSHLRAAVCAGACNDSAARDTFVETAAWVFHPIEDEANVNRRRAAVGLSPLEEYAQMMGVGWKLPAKE